MESIKTPFGIFDCEGDCIGRLSLVPKSSETHDGTVRLNDNILEYFTGKEWKELRKFIDINAPLEDSVIAYSVERVRATWAQRFDYAMKSIKE